jgi:hypothetical protein
MSANLLVGLGKQGVLNLKGRYKEKSTEDLTPAQGLQRLLKMEKKSLCV